MLVGQLTDSRGRKPALIPVLLEDARFRGIVPVQF